MSKKDDYDRAHKERMDELNEEQNLSDIPEKFVKGLFGIPGKIIDDFTETDTESKARHDADDGKYDPPEEKSGCFITTACVAAAGLSDNCHELTILRRFRDTYVASLPDGSALISDYYTTAPQILRAIDRSPDRDRILIDAFNVIRTAIGHIESDRLVEALAEYKHLIATLRDKYPNA